MKRRNPAVPNLVHGMLYPFIALLFVVGAVHQAYAQRNNTSPLYSWSGMNNNFLHLEPDGYSKVWVTTEGGTTNEDFWRQAEEIEMAEDGYYWAKTYDSTHLSTYSAEVEALCDGFVNYVHPATNDMWTSDTYNDDILMAVMAFVRAYNITGTTRWLTDAENNFDAVWTRAQAGDGGLCENTGGGVGCYENSSVNWPFVIAGHVIYGAAGNTGSYLSEAEGVFSWAKSHLYNSSTGEVYDGPTEFVDYSYNYGFAIGASSESSDGTDAALMSEYLFNDMSNATYPYAGTYNGYNVLPNYGQGNLNDSGFNGIAMRQLALANSHGLIPGDVMAAAEANIDSAWSHRDSQELMWNNWVSNTPNSGIYSWDASAGAVGMFTIPTD
jgi:hypothetical protein